ncbi:MAG: ABC transporter ATP-binding protein [Burkholderiales bacterium]|nr:MAG: ABC transporter ATP-binding protein [Betaproteobacteria bacterium]TAG82890.1 MAG: ABC transporter ATP-binding protein [Burkholderiales bacterium]
MSLPPVLETHALNVVRNTTRLIDSLSLSLSGGRVLALLGANGAGKSTLLAALAGEFAATSGSIRLNGKPLEVYTHESLAEIRALNAVEPPLTFSLSVFDFVSLGRPFSEPQSESVRGALAECHATQWVNRDAASLSSGELLRVQLARSLYQLGNAPNSLWLLDEPFAHLDLAQRDFVLKLLRQIATTRRWAIAFSTHEPRDAIAIADEALLLRRGAAIAYGAPSAVLTNEQLTQCFETQLEYTS